MGYNISGLPNYTDQQSRAFVTKSILSSATIAMLADAGSFDPTAKGSQAVQLLDTDIYFQDGTACGRSSNGGATLTQATLSVKDIKINSDYCVRDLETKYAVEDLKAKMKGQIYDDALFLEEIGNLNSAKVSIELEKALWQGDTTLTGTTNLKYVDGFIKSIKAGAYINLSGATGATTTAKLRAIVAAMPIEVTSAADFRVFVGQDTYNTYISEVADKNLFKPADDLTLFGTTVKLAVVTGLNGTNRIVAARLRNLRAGGEMTEGKFEKYYSRETELVYFDSRFSIGCVAIYPQEIGLA